MKKRHDYRADKRAKYVTGERKCERFVTRALVVLYDIAYCTASVVGRAHARALI